MSRNKRLPRLPALLSCSAETRLLLVAAVLVALWGAYALVR